MIFLYCMESLILTISTVNLFSSYEMRTAVFLSH
uniref:Uncharacterized protein n=1 Tax=Anguilla anguilla TaxID=7936 RepID=A0A0E9T1D2_ANGAN